MVKKLLLFGDIHDDMESLEAFSQYAGDTNPDYLLCTGDFLLRPYTIDSLGKLNEHSNNKSEFIKEKKLYSNKKLSQMKAILDKTQIPLLTVAGNYDPGNEDKSLENIFKASFIDAKTAKIGEATILGYGGASAYPPHIHKLVEMGQIKDLNQVSLYNSLKENNPDIVLLHNPPLGLTDNLFNGYNVGSQAATKYIVEDKPKLVIAGHIHEAGPLGNNPKQVKGLAAYEQTVVLNPGNLGKFELINDSTLEKNMEFDYGTFIEVYIEDNGVPTKVIAYSIKEQNGKIGNIQKLAEY